MKNYILFSFLAFFIFGSCNNTENKEKLTSKPCDEDIIFQRLISSVINISDIQGYYNLQTVNNQKQLVILKNKNFENDPTLFKFGLPVLLLSEYEIQRQEIKGYLDFKEIILNIPMAKIFFEYAIEGVGCKLYLNLNDCEWKIDSIDIWEY